MTRAARSSPRILALDSATELCSAALLLGDEVIAVEESTGRGAGERLLAMIDGLLGEGAIALADLDAIAFGRGPGGFTGVRLAASIAQGLAFGAGRPVVAVSDLQALAERGLALETGATRVLVCSDARMQEVYWGVFERAAEGALALERVGAPASVELDPQSTPTVGVGRGFMVYPALAERLMPRLIAIHPTLLPRAQEMLSIAAREWRAGRTLQATEALPVYIRNNIATPRA